eukprot:14967480-Heterocapsa_arctica.AAC.1
MVEDRHFSAVWTSYGGCLWLDPVSLEWVRLVVENHVPVIQPHIDQSGIPACLHSLLNCASSPAESGFGVPALGGTPR